MNISIEKNTFINAVPMVGKFAEKKHSTLPALTAILIVAHEDGISFRATNLETGIDHVVQGTIQTPGVVALPAVLLQQVASALTGDGVVRIEHVGDTVTITSGTSKNVLKTIPYEDFPSIALPEQSGTHFTLPGKDLKQLFSALAPCASTSSVRPELSSIYMRIESSVVTFVATDSFRLVEKRMPIADRSVTATLLLPAKNTLDIASVLPNSDILIQADEHQCAFKTDATTIVSRLTNATYPDYQQIIPKDESTSVTVLKTDFENALKHTSIFSDAFQKVSLSAGQKKQGLTFFAKNQEAGESQESIAAQVTGVDVTLSFNHRFLQAFSTLTTSERLKLSFVGIGRPLVLRGVGDNSLMYLVSPMNQ